MQRARRVALPVVLAFVGALALTGCRSEPGAAIYVGSTKYTQKQVDGLADGLKDVPSISRGDARHKVAEWIVVRDVARKIADDKKWPHPEVNLDETAQTTGLPASAPLTKLYAEYQAYTGLVRQHSTPVAPTDADYADLHRRFNEAGILAPGTDVQQFRDTLNGQDLELVSSTLGLRAIFTEGIKRSNVVVSPRYGPAELAILSDQQNHPLIVLPLDTKPSGSAAVRNG